MQYSLIISALAAGLVAFLLIYLAPIARQVGLIDRPTRRKLHEADVPLIGGISIVVAFMLAMLLMPYSLRDYRMLFFSIAVLLIVGVLDDRKDISAIVKFLIEIILCTLLVLLGSSLITNVGDIFARGVPQGLNILAVPFSIISIVGIINAFNMIDGQDGLAGLSAAVSLIGMAFLCYTIGLWNLVAVCLLLASLTGVFILFNVCLFGKSRQVFLGDAGSMFLGLVIAYFLIKISAIPMPENYVGDYDRQAVLKITAAPWIVGLPLFDLFTSMIRRAIGMQSIFAADRGHVHHRLSDIGYSKTFTVITLVLVHSVFVLVGVLGTIRNWPDWFLFWTPIVLVIIYLAYTVYHEKKMFSKPWKLN